MAVSYQETIVFNEPSPIQHNFILQRTLVALHGVMALLQIPVYGGVGSATNLFLFMGFWGDNLFFS